MPDFLLIRYLFHFLHFTNDMNEHQNKKLRFAKRFFIDCFCCCKWMKDMEEGGVEIVGQYH